MVDLAFALDGDDRIRASVMIVNDPGQPDGGPIDRVRMASRTDPTSTLPGVTAC